MRWTEKEESKLCEYYPQMGIDVVNILPNRTVAAIQKKAIKLGLRVAEPKTGRGPHKHWTAFELNILTAHYAEMGTKVADLLPGRSVEAIAQKATALGITNPMPDWSAGKVEAQCREHIQNGSTDDVIVSCISSDRVGITSRNNEWSNEELTTLLRYFPVEGLTCSKRFPDRTLEAVRSKARRLGLL